MSRRLALLVPLSLLVLGLASAALVAVRWPLSLGDYAWIWGLKARAITRSGELASVFRVDPEGAWSHPEYPPVWPLVLSGLSALAGRYDELLLTVVRPFLHVVICLLVWRLTVAPAPFRLAAAAAASLLPYFREPLYAGYAEPLLLALVLGAVARTESGPACAIPALLWGIAAGTKQEGLVAALVTALVLLRAGRRRQAAAVGGAALLVSVSWLLYRRLHDTSRALADFSLAAFDPAHLARALAVLGRVALLPYAGWLVGGGLLLALAPRTRHRARPLLAGVALYAALLLGSFLFTRHDPAWHVLTTWDRLALVPVVCLIPVLAGAAGEPWDSSVGVGDVETDRAPRPAPVTRPGASP